MKNLIKYIYIPFAILISSCAVEGGNDGSTAEMSLESMYCTKNSCTIINEEIESATKESSEEILTKLEKELNYALKGEGAYNTFLVTPASESTQVLFVDLDSAFMRAGINPHKVLVILSSRYFREDRVEKTEQMMSLQSLKEGLALYHVGDKKTADMEAVFLLTEVEEGYEGLKNSLSSDYVFPFTINFEQLSAN